MVSWPWQPVITNSINPCPAEPGNTLPLQTVQIQISWLLKKPIDLNYTVKKPTDLNYTVIQYVNLYQQPRSSNLIGWQLEVGVAS